MPSVYHPDNFAGRVSLAASVIQNRRQTTRSFDTCFEMYDGKAVVAALCRRAKGNPKLAANLPHYICAESIAAGNACDRANLAAYSRELRAAAEAANAAYWASRAQAA